MRGCLLLLALGVLTMMTAAGTYGEEDVFGLTEDGKVLMDLGSGVQENLVNREVREIKKNQKVKKAPKKAANTVGRKQQQTAPKKVAKAVGGKQQTKQSAKMAPKKVVRTVNGKQKAKTAAKKGQTAKKQQPKKTPKTPANKQSKRIVKPKKKNKPPVKSKQPVVPANPFGRADTEEESCDVNQVSDTCLENALTSLEFEKNQVQNFYKQKERAKNHNKTIGGKLNKKDEFSSAAELMEDALGGNISDPSCASNSTSAAALAAIANFHTLNNCSATIEEACTMPAETYSANDTAKFETCNTIFKTFQQLTTDCRTLDVNKVNGTSACACWAGAVVGVKAAKSEGCKATSTAKAVKKQRATCLDAFGICKKAEDSAVSLIHACMSGDIKSSAEAEKDMHSGRSNGGLKDFVYFSTEYPDSPWY